MKIIFMPFLMKMLNTGTNMIPEEEHLAIMVNEDLSSLSYHSCGVLSSVGTSPPLALSHYQQLDDTTLLCTVRNPSLLLNEVLLQRLNNGHVVLRLFSRGFHLHVENRVHVWCHPFVFPPAIDALFFQLVLAEWFRDTSPNIETAWDVGCGTGFLGISLLTLGVKHCLFTDIQSEALINSSFNVDVFNSFNERAVIRQHDGIIPFPLSFRGRKTVDLLVCNPPYLPLRLLGNDLPAWTRDSATWGLNLLHQVKDHWFEVANECFLLFSSITGLKPEDFVNSKDFIELEAVMTRNAFFRIPSILKNDEVVDHLVAEEKLFPGEPYPQHQLHVIKLKRKLSS